MQLFTHHTSDPQPHGTVLICHGYAEHQGRYRRLVDSLNHDGYDAVTFDLSGHGSAGGPRAQVDVGRLITEHRAARADALANSRTSQLFVLGHSMGGIITAASVLIDPDHVAGMVLTGPAFRPAAPITAKVARSMLTLARVAPGLPTAKLDAGGVSRDPDVVDDYENDPLNFHGPVPLITALTMCVQGDHGDNWACRATPRRREPIHSACPPWSSTAHTTILLARVGQRNSCAMLDCHWHGARTPPTRTYASSTAHTTKY